MKKIGERILFEGKWLLFKELTYVSKEGREFKWEAVERRKSRDVIVVVARLVPSERYILIKEFRPAIENYIIGLPAGILESDDVAYEAMKELHEETGYTGTVTNISPPLKLNAALLRDNVYVVYADVDETTAENKNPKQSLEPAEEIEVILCKRSEIGELFKKEHAEGHDVGVGIWYLFGLDQYFFDKS